MTKNSDSCKLPGLDISQQAMRTCLKCDADPETGEYPMFMSLSPAHRTCDKCSNEKEGHRFVKINTSHIPASGNFMQPVEAAFMSDAEAKAMLGQG